MRMFDIIDKKKHGKELTKEEISYFVKGVTSGEIPDYQTSALLMAICFKGMTDEETAELTLAMAASGDEMDLSHLSGIKVDKHSTGGIGDKTTLILGPLMAACHLPVVKMSGRGLGLTGGTIDKLEAIPNLSCSLSMEDFFHQVEEIGVAVASQTASLAPCDKKLYALRDTTATVDCIPLIASSIMSKKLASGSDAIVLDVKYGSGAFMKTEEDAKKLATIMVTIGEHCGRRMDYVISDMEQPLGQAVGNSIEVNEAVRMLKGEGPQDLREVVFQLGAKMLLLGDIVSTEEEAVKLMEEHLSDGSALEKFREMIRCQGGDASFLDTEELLPLASYTKEILATEDGVVTKVAADIIGHTALDLGAGRATKDDAVDPGSGVFVCKKVGDKVKKGEVLAKIYTSSEDGLLEAQKECAGAFVIEEQSR
ncbi:MAG: pyrimidine-nucleoside phosphorylase [Lachnospiraceae bacterium]|nr:pyrimidine-nucleoside phosphorylase [Lachnospiraceae bacterium]